jgi:EpsI family protein
MDKRVDRRAALLAVAVGSLGLAEFMRPRQHLSKVRARIDLARQVPTDFGHWREAKGLAPVLPDPEVQSRLDALYSQVLARNYVNAEGHGVMLSIAYGSDQSSEATSVHRPEFCYGAQGFQVRNLGVASLDVGGNTALQVQRLLATQTRRVEPISYWITLDELATLPGLGRKMAQIQFGLKGQIADGMLVRVSNLTKGGLEEDFAMQRDFIASLKLAISPEVRARYFGV